MRRRRLKLATYRYSRRLQAHSVHRSSSSATLPCLCPLSVSALPSAAALVQRPPHRSNTGVSDGKGEQPCVRVSTTLPRGGSLGRLACPLENKHLLVRNQYTSTLSANEQPTIRHLNPPPLRRYLQKPSFGEAEASGAFLPSSSHPEVAIDSGVVVFSAAATAALAGLAYSEMFRGCTARGVAGGAAALRLELYSDLLLALKTGATSEGASCVRTCWPLFFFSTGRERDWPLRKCVVSFPFHRQTITNEHTTTMTTRLWFSTDQEGWLAFLRPAFSATRRGRSYFL